MMTKTMNCVKINNATNVSFPSQHQASNHMVAYVNAVVASALQIEQSGQIYMMSPQMSVTCSLCALSIRGSIWRGSSRAHLFFVLHKAPLALRERSLNQARGETGLAVPASLRIWHGRTVREGRGLTPWRQMSMALMQNVLQITDLAGWDSAVEFVRQEPHTARPHSCG